MDHTNCLVVACEEWESVIPAWLLRAIAFERELVAVRTAMSNDLKPHGKVGDAEALAYLLTLFRVTPLAFGWYRIFMYLARTVAERYKPGKPMPELSDDVYPSALDAVEEQELQKLKSEIFEARGDIWHPLYSFDFTKPKGVTG